MNDDLGGEFLPQEDGEGEDWSVFVDGQSHPEFSKSLQNGEFEVPKTKRGGYRPKRGRPKGQLGRKQPSKKQKYNRADLEDGADATDLAKLDDNSLWDSDQQDQRYQDPIQHNQTIYEALQQFPNPVDQRQEQSQQHLSGQLQQLLPSMQQSQLASSGQQPRKRPKLNPKFLAAEIATDSSLWVPPPKSRGRGRPKLNPQFSTAHQSDYPVTSHTQHLEFATNDPTQHPDSSVNDPIQNLDYSDSLNTVSGTKGPKKNPKRNPKTNLKKMSKDPPSPELDPVLLAKDAKKLTKAAKRLVKHFQTSLHYRWRVSATEYGLIVHVERGKGGGGGGGTSAAAEAAVRGVVAEVEEDIRQVGANVGIMDEFEEKIEVEEELFQQEFDADEEEALREDVGEEQTNALQDDLEEGEEIEGNDQQQFLTSEDERSKDGIYSSSLGDVVNSSSKVGAESDKNLGDVRQSVANSDEVTQPRGDFHESSPTPSPDAQLEIKEEEENEDYLLALSPEKKAEALMTKIQAPTRRITARESTQKKLTDLDAAPSDNAENFPIDAASVNAGVTTDRANSLSASPTPDDAFSLLAPPPSKPAPPIVLQGAHCIALSRLAPRILAHIDELSSSSSSIPLHSRDLLYECHWCRRNFKCRSSLLFHKSQSHNPITADEFKMLRRYQ